MDPNPIKHIGSLLKRVRARIEPALFSAGFLFDNRNKPPPGDPTWLDYRRSGMLVSLRYEQHDAQLVAEILDEQEARRSVVTPMNAPRSTTEILARIDVFTSAVLDLLATLPHVSVRKKRGK